MEKGHGRVSSNGFKVYGKVDDNQFYGAERMLFVRRLKFCSLPVVHLFFPFPYCSTAGRSNIKVLKTADL